MPQAAACVQGGAETRTRHLVLPTPDQICIGPESWGRDGRYVSRVSPPSCSLLSVFAHLVPRWIEPWDDDSARQAIKKLEAIWRPDSSARAGKALEDDSDSQPCSSVQNEDCQHAACSAQHFCFLSELDRVRRNYSGKADSFRLKAVNKAISVLSQLTSAIKNDADIDRLLWQVTKICLNPKMLIMFGLASFLGG